MSANNRDEIPPPNVTDEERWIVRHYVDTIRVEYRQTGVDTAETYVHLKAGKNEVCWHSSTFNKVARLYLSHNACVETNYGVREKVKAREEWEKKHASELALYKQLKEKFGE